MSATANGEEVLYTISAVERETGLSKDTLRVWERRYRFPKPQRDPHGERVYAQTDVDKLRLVKQLVDRGHRPSKLVELTLADLRRLAESTSAGFSDVQTPPELRRFMGLLKAHRTVELRAALAQELARDGLQRFVLHTVAPLNVQVGLAWMRGDFEVFEEHLYTETVQGLLRTAISGLPEGTEPPRVIVTTLPNEQHELGLLMVQSLLVLERTMCHSLGPHTPVREIAKAAITQEAEIVGLSFSAAYPVGLLVEGLQELRTRLPQHVEIWAGGANPGLARCSMPGLRILGRIEDVQPALAEWRGRHGLGEAALDYGSVSTTAE